MKHLEDEKLYHESEHLLRINGQKELREGKWNFEKPVYPNTLNDYVPHGYGRWLYQGSWVRRGRIAAHSVNQVAIDQRPQR